MALSPPTRARHRIRGECDGYVLRASRHDNIARPVRPLFAQIIRVGPLHAGAPWNQGAAALAPKNNLPLSAESQSTISTAHNPAPTHPDMSDSGSKLVKSVVN